MNREALENRIKHYFTQEGAEGDLSSRQWREVLSHVRKQKQRRWPWGSAISSMPRPLTAMAVSLVLAVVVGGISLWVTAPWQATSPGQPGPDQPSPVNGLREVPGRPAPRHFEATWAADRSLFSPGEALTITGTLKNVWDQSMDVVVFPETVTLDLVDTRDTVAVPLTVALGIPNFIEPGQEVTFVAHVPTDVSARLQPGRYNVGIEITFAHTPGKPQDGTTRVGLNSGILFVVVPPQGALNKTVEVGEVREVNGVRITLEAIRFTPEKTTIVALAVLTGPRPPQPTSPPPPSPGAMPTPPPTATPAPTAPPPGREYSTNPWYRTDGGEWRELRGSRSYRETPEGIHLEWTLGPVPADAKTFDFAISRLGDLVVSPGQQVIGPWEWTVRLQEAGR